MRILILGNPLVEIDSLPLRILDRLKENFPKIIFQEFDPTENLESFGRNLIIIDSAICLMEVKLIQDLDQIYDEKKFSMHDYDLGINLKLLKKLHLIDSIKIIAIPSTYSEEKAFLEVSKIISSLS